MVIWGVCVCVSPSIPHAKVCVFVKGQYLSQSGRQLALSSCHADFRALPPRRGRVAGSAGDLDLTPCPMPPELPSTAPQKSSSHS